VKTGFKVIGFDNDTEKIKHLEAGKTYIKHIPDEEIKVLKGNGSFKRPQISRNSGTSTVSSSVFRPL